MDPVLPDDLVMLQRSVREFVEEKLAPFERPLLLLTWLVLIGASLVATWRAREHFRGWLARERVLILATESVFLAGLATDFCVAYSAVDARKAGFEVVVIEDACRAIDTGGSLAAAWARMNDAGVARTASTEVVG